MLIPIAIGLVVSTIFLNLNFFIQGDFITSGQNKRIKTGQVLGAAEYNGQGEISVEQDNYLNQALAQVIEEVKTLPLPQLFQLPQLDQPIERLPLSQDDPPAGEQEPAIINFDFPAEVGLISDSNGDKLFFAKRPDRTWPIASITKLFTALTFLDYNPGFETSYVIKPSDKREGGKIYLFTGDQVTVQDLFYFSLVGSDNTATAALVQTTGLSEGEFIEKINDKIKALGLKHTRIVDPVGLNDGNISTAREIAEFSRIALANPEINRASLTKKYEFTTKQGRKKSIINTNELLASFPDKNISILGGKTGYINASGYCLVSQFKNDQGKTIVTVVLGADTDAGRFSITERLVDLYYKNGL